MTTFFELNPDLFTDQGEDYKKVTGAEDSAYNFNPNLDVDNYDVDAEVDENYFKGEIDTLDLLIRNMFGYVSKCYGIYGDVIEIQNEDGTYEPNCPNGGFPTTIDGYYTCASTADSKIVGFWEYITYKLQVGSFFGLKNEHEKYCEALAASYPGGTKYKTEGKQHSPETLKKYWEFLETSTYFDNKAHLKHYFQTILQQTNHASMKELSETEREEYSEELITIRKRIVENIKSILASRGSKVDAVRLSSINNSLYWWPVGGSEITTDGSGREYAMGEPVSISVSSSFGYRTHPTTGEPNTFHTGIDIAAPEGTNIIAARSGIVETIVEGCISGGDHSCGGGYGNYIVISHGDGNYTLYAHLYQNSIAVKKGDSVNQGQLIGKMGSSGRSTGSHLHFEIRIGSNDSSSAVDPLTYISIENPRASTFSVNLIEGNTVQETLCKTLLANNYSQNGTIALMVNAKAESSFNPAIDGDNGTSFGLFQWHDTRKSNLINMFPNNYSSVDAQISFLKYELENGYYQLYDSLLVGSETGEKLAYNFCVQFERPAGGSATCQARAASHINEMTSYVSNQCQ